MDPIHRHCGDLGGAQTSSHFASALGSGFCSVPVLKDCQADLDMVTSSKCVLLLQRQHKEQAEALRLVAPTIVQFCPRMRSMLGLMWQIRKQTEAKCPTRNHGAFGPAKCKTGYCISVADQSSKTFKAWRRLRS